jgi:hypothetical protein
MVCCSRASCEGLGIGSVHSACNCQVVHLVGLLPRIACVGVRGALDIAAPVHGMVAVLVLLVGCWW